MSVTNDPVGPCHCVSALWPWDSNPRTRRDKPMGNGLMQVLGGAGQRATGPDRVLRDPEREVQGTTGHDRVLGRLAMGMAVWVPTDMGLRWKWGKWYMAKTKGKA